MRFPSVIEKRGIKIREVAQRPSYVSPRLNYENVDQTGYLLQGVREEVGWLGEGSKILPATEVKDKHSSCFSR